MNDMEAVPKVAAFVGIATVALFAIVMAWRIGQPKVDTVTAQASDDTTIQFDIVTLLPFDAIPAIDKALEGIKGTTALHLCMGYAAMIKQRYDAYHFLTELAECTVDQISLETAQPDLDLSVLGELSGKDIILGVINMDDMAVEAPETVAERIERAYPHVPPERIIPAPDCGFKYIARDISFAKLQALVAGTDLARSRLS